MVFFSQNYYNFTLFIIHKLYKTGKEFRDWALALRPKDVKDRGISERTSYNIKHMIKQGKILNPRLKLFKFRYNYIKKLN